MPAVDSKHILIVLLGSLGDVARGLFVANYIKTHRPNWKISWLVEPKSQGLVESSADVDNVIVFNRQLGLNGLLRLKAELRRYKFDVSIDLQRHFKSGVFAWLGSASRRIGFPQRDTKEFNWLFQTEYAADRQQPTPKLLQYFDQVQSLGLDLPEVGGELRLCPVNFKQISSSIVERVLQLFSGAYIVVVLSTSWKSKYWPSNHYKALVEKFLL